MGNLHAKCLYTHLFTPILVHAAYQRFGDVVVGVFHVHAVHLAYRTRLVVGGVGLLCKFNHFAIVCTDITGGAKQVGLAQAAAGHLFGVVFKTEMCPHKVKNTRFYRLNVAGRQ